MANTGGGAATNSGIDYQQRVAAFLVLYMDLDLDCSRILEKPNNIEKITKVSFETDDDIDDIVLTHKSSKSYLQVKRMLTLSDKVNSEFFKTIDQFVRQFNSSQNNEDSFVAITSNDTSKSISKDLRKITKSSRLTNEAQQHNPLSKSEKEAYQKLISCIKKSFKQNNYDKPTDKIIEALIKQIYFVILDVEQDGINEKYFLETLNDKFNVKTNLIWNLLIAQALGWSKNRQSIDVEGINKLLDKFRSHSNEQEVKVLDSIFKVNFDPDNYNICSGREIIVQASLLSDFDYALVELYRFDDDGNFRIKFHEDSVEWGDGSKFKIYGRFSTFKGAERFIENRVDLHDGKLVLMPMNGDYNYDESPIAKLYSDKVRSHILAKNDTTKCIHCQNGLSHPSLLIEVQEEGLPFDAGNIHNDCLRPSDRVLGMSMHEGNSELNNFDINKWLSLLDKSQGLWCGMEAVNQSVRNVLWNSNPVGDPNGAFCIKVTLKNGSHQYTHERGKVQRYNKDVAYKVGEQLNEWLVDSLDKNSPLCYSSDGNIQGMHDDLQKNSSSPLDLVECTKFTVVKFTRGIAVRHDKLNNFYAPLIIFVDVNTGDYILFDHMAFLLTDPIELKLYLDNWNSAGFTLQSYRIDIIETDAAFDKFMHWSKQNNVDVLVDPFFDRSNQLIKGSVIEDLEGMKQSHEHEKESEERFCLLFTTTNDDGTFTHLYRDFVNDVTLLLYDKCSNGDCSCMGCQMYAVRARHYGSDNLDVRHANEKTVVLNLSDSESDWEKEFLKEHCVSWADWEPIVT
ncbi:hypothetical protein [Pseudoalteromonas arctica]|uniref:hypothetical protein n=1 Tax=Pseudoalteromonas arctica TaxID=394751 RepID=UPI0024940814|nr:hypothetical protein [Pseudoalteromonas arctica]